MKNKPLLRIGTFIIILMFVLVPLLSSPVAAAFTQNLGSVWTINTTGGPTAGGTVGAPPTISDSSPFNAQFVVEYSYTDSNPGGSGSNHWTEIIVYYQPPGMGWRGPVTFTQAPPIFITAGGGTRIGTYITTWLIGYGGKGTNFDVYVVVNCQDIAGPFTFTWTSNVISFTIV